jgi:hypothetical protein
MISPNPLLQLRTSLTLSPYEAMLRWLRICAKNLETKSRHAKGMHAYTDVSGQGAHDLVNALSIILLQLDLEIPLALSF